MLLFSEGPTMSKSQLMALMENTRNDSQDAMAHIAFAALKSNLVSAQDVEWVCRKLGICAPGEYWN